MINDIYLGDGVITVEDSRKYGWAVTVYYMPDAGLNSFGASGCLWLVPGTAENE